MRKPLYLIALVIFSLVLTVPGFSDNDLLGRASLEARRNELREQVNRLTLEQDYLLFEKLLSSSDSRYLVLHPFAGTGQLKFRQKTLLDFRFQPWKKGSVKKPMLRGIQTVTKKQEAPGGDMELLFCSSLVIRSNSGLLPTAIPAIVLDQPAMASLFSALEKNSFVYVVQ